MRILFWRLHDGVLTLINAVLGAAVVLPKIMLSADNIDVDLFDELDDERARKVLDMHFYTVNYWRECISAFVGQLQPMMRSKVLTRLTEVIELEGRIREIMQMAPDDYVPPNCLFTSEKTASKFKRPAGKKIKMTPLLARPIHSNSISFSAGSEKSSSDVKKAKNCRQIGNYSSE